MADAAPAVAAGDGVSSVAAGDGVSSVAAGDGVSSVAAGDGARLLLLAHAADEVPLVSALVQDAIVHAADIAWQPRARRLVLLVSRLRREAGSATRIRCALRLESVTGLRRRAWPAGDAVLALLAVTAAADALTLTFAGGATLRAEVECVDLIVEDVGEPWRATREPAHFDGR